jgi:hypothetical protein
MRRGTAFADRKETKFASLGLRISVALQSYRHGRRSMDQELKEFRSQGDVLRPIYEALFEQVGQTLWGLSYHMRKNAEEQAARC